MHEFLSIQLQFLGGISCSSLVMVMFLPSDNTTNEFSPLGCVYRGWIQSCPLCGVSFSRKAPLGFLLTILSAIPIPLHSCLPEKFLWSHTTQRHFYTHWGNGGREHSLRTQKQGSQLVPCDPVVTGEWQLDCYLVNQRKSGSTNERSLLTYAVGLVLHSPQVAHHDLPCSHFLECRPKLCL